MLTMT